MNRELGEDYCGCHCGCQKQLITNSECDFGRCEHCLQGKHLGNMDRA